MVEDLGRVAQFYLFGAFFIVSYRKSMHLLRLSCSTTVLAELFHPNNMSFALDSLEADGELVLEQGFPDFRKLTAHLLKRLLIHLE